MLPPGTSTPVRLSYDPAAPAGTSPAGDLALAYNWYGDGAFSVDAVIPPTGKNWSGTWRVVFVDPTGQNPEAVSRTQLTIQADLGAVVDPAATVDWRVGEDLGPVPFALVRSDGSPAVLGDPAPTLALDVVLHAADGTETPLAQAVPGSQLAAGVPLSIPADVAPGPAELRAVLAVTTVSGQTLQPQIRTEQVTVAPPLGFPTLETESIDFGTIEGDNPGTASIQVTGPGCVWVSNGALRVHPADVADATVAAPGADDEKNCQAIGEGETSKVEVSLEPGAPGDGRLQGDLVVHLAPTDHTERAIAATIPYSADLQLPANKQVLALAFALALLIGIGLPILVFLLGRHLAARLPGTPLQSALLDVRVGPGGLTAAGGDGLAVTTWDLVPPPDQGRRRAMLSRIPVRARAGSRLTEAGFAEVDDPTKVGVTGSPGGRSAKLRARLPLGLQGSWTLLMDRSMAESDAPEVPAQLLIVSDALATSAQREQLLARARAEGPAAAEDVRTAAREARPTDGPAGRSGPAPAPADPFGSAPFGSGGSTQPAADPFAPAQTGTAFPARDPFGGGPGFGTPGSGSWPPPADDPFRR